MGEREGNFPQKTLKPECLKPIHHANELPADHALGQEAVEHLTAGELF
jgi:hypothetical protein